MLLGSDDFPGSSLGSTWNAVRGTFAVSSGTVTVSANGTSGPVPRNLALWGTKRLADVLVSMKVGPNWAGSGTMYSVVARGSLNGSSQFSGYALRYLAATSLIQVSIVVDDATSVSDVFDPDSEGTGITTTLAAGDIIGLRVRGYQIDIVKNGVVLGSTADALKSFAAGLPGFGINNTTASLGLQSWSLRAERPGPSRARNRSRSRASPSSFYLP